MQQRARRRTSLRQSIQTALVRLTSILAAIVLGLGVGYLTPRQWVNPAEYLCEVTFYVSGNWLHTNIILPQHRPEPGSSPPDDILLALARALQSHSTTQAAFVSVGWGDRAFYMNTPTLSDVRLSTVLRALFWPTPTALHVQNLISLPAEQSDYTIQPITTSLHNYHQLVTFIMNSLARDTHGNVVALQSPHRFDGRFYAATGHYHALNTCNDWTANALRSAHVNTALWSGLAPAVFHHLQSHCNQF